MSKIQEQIAKARAGGHSDQEIWQHIQKMPKHAMSIEKARVDGHSQQSIAQGLGLNITVKPAYVAPNLNAERKENMRKAAKEAGPTKLWESALLGASDLGAGIVQGASYVADGVSTGLNKLLGTNIDNKSYERVTKNRNEVDEWHNLKRSENNQGFDIARLGGQVAATAPMAALGRGFGVAKVISKDGVKVLAQNAGVGAGIGGASFAKDSKQRAGNTVLGAAGGAGGAVVGDKIGKAVVSAGKRFNPSQVTNAQVENTIDILLSQADDGVKALRLADLPVQARAQLTAEVKKVMRSGQTPDAQTLQRSAVFADIKSRGTDLKPTIKQAAGNAQTWTKETELSKLHGAENLAAKYTQDHKNLKTLLDDFELKTGGTASDEFQVGDEMYKALRSQDDARSNYIAAMYDQAKTHTGNDLLLDGGRFANNMKQSLDEDLVDISLLPAPLLKKVQDFADGVKPFTLTEKEILVKQLNRRISGADSQTKYALQSFRNSLEKEVDDSLGAFGTQLQGQAKTAWDDARKAASGRFGLIERTPALKKAIGDAEPDKAFDQLVWRGNVRELESLITEIKHDPQVLNGMRQAVVKRIANKAVGVNDVFSPKGMSDALKTVGDRKLALLFNADELKYLKNIELAGRYLLSHPPGANVNHSNTASTLMNHFNVLSKAPLAKAAIDKWVISPSRGVNAQIKINQGANAVSKTATNTTPTQAELTLMEKLVKAGVISGTAISNE